MTVDSVTCFCGFGGNFDIQPLPTRIGTAVPTEKVFWVATSCPRFVVYPDASVTPPRAPGPHCLRAEMVQQPLLPKP